MLFGQILAALAGPMYNSLPPALAAAWFSISERDIATAIGSLFNPLGNAAGQVIYLLNFIFYLILLHFIHLIRFFLQFLLLKMMKEQLVVLFH